MESAGPPVLEYAAADGAAQRPLPALLRATFLLVAFGAAFSPFLSFAYGTSPLDTLPFDDRHVDLPLMLVGLPFFAGCVALAWKLRLLGPPTHVIERVAVHVMALLFASATAGFIARGGSEGGLTFLEWTTIAVAPLILTGGTVLLVWFRRKRRPDDAAFVAVCTAYAANAVMCLLIFWGSRYPGWLLTAAVILGMLSEAVTTVVWTARRR
jgi:hypothetical protein